MLLASPAAIPAAGRSVHLARTSWQCYDRVEGVGFRVLGFRVLGFRVSGSGF